MGGCRGRSRGLAGIAGAESPSRGTGGRTRLASVSDVGRAHREAAAARAAGWRRSEVWWERLQARAKAGQSGGDLRSAARYWMLAYRLGWLTLPRDDPRFACSLANAAAAADHYGRSRAAGRRRRRAQLLWRAVPAWVERIRAVPRARSSLFHLRLARRHAETYTENLRTRLREQVGEAQASLASGVLEPPALRCRWIHERPPVFDDTRRLLSACFLMAYAAPAVQRAEPAGARLSGAGRESS